MVAADRKELPPNSLQLAGSLTKNGYTLMNLKEWADAEPVLRDALAIRLKSEPGAWGTFHTQSVLGGTLLGRKNYAEAEPLLLEAGSGLLKLEAKIPPEAKIRLFEGLERLVQLYTSLEKPVEAAQWKAKLDELQARLKK
jgi:hypothetical protein